MPVLKRRPRAVAGAFAAVAALCLVLVSQASAVTYTNACSNTVSPNNSQINVTMTADDSPDPVAPNGSVSLTNIDQTVSVPGAIFVAGYRLFLLGTGPNTVPATVTTVIEGTNTADGTQTTNGATGSISFTISDPTPTNRNSGDETATDGTLSVSYNDETWTAGATEPSTIDFRQDTPAVYPTGGTGGTIHIAAVINNALPVDFACAPGTVAPTPGSTDGNPGIPSLTDPAASFATTLIQTPPNQAPTAAAGNDQTVDSGQTGVQLDGTGSSDPENDTLTYSWTQTGGTTVSLSGANTATATFDAPTGPDTLTFQLEVCDQEPLCDTDTVTVNVNAPVIEVVDAELDVIVNGPTSTRAGDKTVVGKVTNLGTGSLTVCDTDIDWNIEVNNTPTTGTVSPLNAGCKTLSPGGSTRFRYNWTYGSGEVSAGANVDYAATVNVTDDSNAGNDSDTETRTAK